jgi:hypothetical protein
MQSSADVVELLDFPVISLMTLGKDGDYPHLVAVARRQLPNATRECIRWYGELHLTDQVTCITRYTEPTMRFRQTAVAAAVVVLALTLMPVFLWMAAEVFGKGNYGVRGPLSTTVNTGSFNKLPGGSGGKVLNLNILSASDTPRLVIWAVTNATFGGRG